MNRVVQVGVVGILIVVVATGCEHADPVGSGGLEPTLTSIEENIFSTSCALSQCHAPPNPQQGMDLSAGQAFGSIVNVPSRERPSLDRVEPGDPEASYLVHKIEGRSGIVGARMPRGRPPLTSEEIEAIRTWILDGAPNN